MAENGSRRRQKQKTRTGFDISECIGVRNAVLISVSAIICLIPLVIYLNTTGVFLRWFGWQSESNYLYFDTNWGNLRGFSWKFAAELYAGMSPLQKLLGAGPDCFAAYSYSIPEYVTRLNRMWGEGTTLTNPHNEFLNMLICYGIVGAALYIAMLCAGVKRFFQGRKNRYFPVAAGLCILSYMGHNFFCYQQVCATPFLFIIMGIGEHMSREGKEFILA